MFGKTFSDARIINFCFVTNIETSLSNITLNKSVTNLKQIEDLLRHDITALTPFRVLGGEEINDPSPPLGAD